MKSSLWTPNSLVLFSAAVLAGIIAGTLVSAVVVMFQSRGAPLGMLAAAERACTHHLYRSQQEACLKDWLAVKRTIRVANH